MLHSKRMFFAGYNFGTLELSQDVEGHNNTFLVLNFHLETSVDQSKVLEVVKQVFRQSEWFVENPKSLDGKEYIQISCTLPTIIRNKCRFLRSKAHHMARLLTPPRQQIEIYNGFLEHEASFFPGYVEGADSLRAFKAGQINSIGKFIQ